MGIVIIKNRQDAQDYLINQFAPTDSDNRASNALLGAALGGLGGGLLGTAVKKKWFRCWYWSVSWSRFRRIFSLQENANPFS